MATRTNPPRLTRSITNFKVSEHLSDATASPPEIMNTSLPLAQVPEVIDRPFPVDISSCGDTPEIRFEEVFTPSDKDNDYNRKTLEIINQFVRKYIYSKAKGGSGSRHDLVIFAKAFKYHRKTLENLLIRHTDGSKHVFTVTTFSKLRSKKNIVELGMNIHEVNIDVFVESIEEIAEDNGFSKSTPSAVDVNLFISIYEASTDHPAYGSTSEINASTRFTSFLRHFISGIDEDGKILYIVGDQLPHGHRNKGTGSTPIEVQHIDSNGTHYHTFLSGTLDYVFVSFKVDIATPKSSLDTRMLLERLNSQWDTFCRKVPRKLKLPDLFLHIEGGFDIFRGYDITVDFGDFVIFPMEMKSMSTRFIFDSKSNKIIPVTNKEASDEDPSSPTHSIDIQGSPFDSSKPQEWIIEPGHMLFNQNIWAGVREDLGTLSPETHISPSIIDLYLTVVASQLPNCSLSYVPYTILNGLESEVNNSTPSPNLNLGNTSKETAIGILGQPWTSPDSSSSYSSSHVIDYCVVVALRESRQIYILGQDPLSNGETGDIRNLVGYGGVVGDGKRNELKELTRVLWKRICCYLQMDWKDLGASQVIKFRSTDWFQSTGRLDSGANACEVVRGILESGFYTTGGWWDIPQFPCAHDIRWAIYLTIHSAKIKLVEKLRSDPVDGDTGNSLLKVWGATEDENKFYRHHFYHHICTICENKEVEDYLLQVDHDANSDRENGLFETEEVVVNNNSTTELEHDEGCTEAIEDMIQSPCLAADGGVTNEHVQQVGTASGLSTNMFGSKPDLKKNVQQIVGECLAIYNDPDLKHKKERYMKFLISTSNEYLWGVVDCEGTGLHKVYITNTMEVNNEEQLRKLVFVMEAWVILTGEQVYKRFQKTLEW